MSSPGLPSFVQHNLSPGIGPFSHRLEGLQEQKQRPSLPLLTLSPEGSYTTARLSSSRSTFWPSRPQACSPPSTVHVLVSKCLRRRPAKTIRLFAGICMHCSKCVSTLPFTLIFDTSPQKSLGQSREARAYVGPELDACPDSTTNLQDHRADGRSFETAQDSMRERTLVALPVLFAQIPLRRLRGKGATWCAGFSHLKSVVRPWPLLSKSRTSCTKYISRVNLTRRHHPKYDKIR